MSISGIRSPQDESDRIMSEIKQTSEKFYKDDVQGNKLMRLMKLARGYQDNLYSALNVFFDRRRFTVIPPTVLELKDILSLLSDLKKIYSEIEIQEKRLVIKALRKIGANPKVAATSMVISVLIGAYIIISFGITPEFENKKIVTGLIVSGAIVVCISVILTFILEYLKMKYKKIKIEEAEILERNFLSGYFKAFGKKDYLTCIESIKKINTNLKLQISYENLTNLLYLAKDCLAILEKIKTESKNDDSSQDMSPVDNPFFNDASPIEEEFQETLSNLHRLVIAQNHTQHSLLSASNSASKLETPERLDESEEALHKPPSIASDIESLFKNLQRLASSQNNVINSPHFLQKASSQFIPLHQMSQTLPEFDYNSDSEDENEIEI